MAWVLAAGVAVLVPALLHGVYLGPFDILSTDGLTATHGGVVHNFDLRDLISSFIPSTEQAWTQVHNGHLPLWNPYSALGLPLAFNWQSAPFGLPALVGYLFPLHSAYTAGVLVSLVVAGSGGYVFGRVLRLGAIASAFVGTTFVLSGSMVALLGWSATSVGSWSGWLFASAVLVVRGHRRVYAVCAFAVVIALMIYAGHPETAFLLSLTLAIFLAVVLVRRAPRVGGSGPILRPVVDVVIGGAAGAGLAAPLLLPGLQIVFRSVRSAADNSSGNYASLTTPDHGFLQLFFQGFDGIPVAGSHWFGQLSYQWDAAYVGVIALVMIALALRIRWWRPEVQGLAAGAVVMATLALIPGVPSAVSGLPLIGNIVLTRALIPLAFGLSVLAGIGLDVLVRDHRDAPVRRWALGGFATAAVVLVAAWLFGRGHLPLTEARIRETSFIWPTICTVVGLLAVGGLCVAIRNRRSVAKVTPVVAMLLLACQTAFLVAAGAPLAASSASVLQPSPAVASLQKTVGSSLVGLGAETCIVSTYFGSPGIGILPESNVLFQVHELATDDPLVPSSYFSTWRDLTGNDGGSTYFLQFCPAVTSVRIAQRFGIGYVLEPHGANGPVGGSVFVGSVGGEGLYRIPDAAPATLVPAPSPRVIPANDARGTPVVVRHPDPATWSMVTQATSPQELRLRLTDLPGWHATIDGRPLALQQFSGVMLQARIPAGRHAITLRYWPTTFSVGLVVAACSAVGLATAVLFEWARRRKSSRIAAS